MNIKHTGRSIGVKSGERRMEITRDSMLKRVCVTENRLYTNKCVMWLKEKDEWREGHDGIMGF